MLDINWICDNLDLMREGLAAKAAKVDLDAFVALNQKRKALQHRSDEIKHERKTNSADFSKAAKAGGDLEAIKAKANALKDEERDVDQQLGDCRDELQRQVMLIPNLPHPAIPRGGPENNRVVRTEGVKPELSFEGRDHLALCESLGGIDVQNRGVKVAGSGFALFMGQGARLTRALINFMLDLHTQEHGYTEVSPPFIVNRQTMTGTGQLPKFEDDLYHCSKDDLFLVPTAEVPVTNLHAGEILKLTDLPIAYTAYTPCFRREAGSYGADTRGLMRLHQFDKVELVRFTRPEDSEAEHERLLGHAERVLRELGLHYRVLELASGDMSFSAWRCYDLEAWAPVSKRWFEVSSVSNFGAYQARRANIRVRTGEKKVEFVHTLNGSGLALPRVILCILEQYQRPDGSIALPPALHKYFGAEQLDPPAKA